MSREHCGVSDLEHEKTIPFLVEEHPRLTGRGNETLADGSYPVLATLVAGGNSYRVFAELAVKGAIAQLRVHRFDSPGDAGWSAERKINVPVFRPEIAPLEPKLRGAEFLLRAPVQLDGSNAAAIFGPSGPPAT